MLDSLRRDPRQALAVDLGDRHLPIEITRNPRARRLTLRLAPDGSAARLTVPRWVPTREALAFAQSRADWLAAQLVNVAAPVVLADGAVVPRRGIDHVLRHAVGAPRRVRVDGDRREIHLGGAAESLGARLSRWLKGEARECLAQDLAFYCDRAGQPLPQLALASAQRRWGSCSARGGIRINWRLIMAPDAVRRSVVAHEVAHLTHFDHSPAFKGHLAALYDGDLPAADRWLRAHGRSLYAPFG